MRDTDLYKQILGLENPWYVSRVELKVAEKRVDIWIEHDFGVQWECPKCSQTFTCRDHAEERIWRHMDTCQFRTYLHARIPRIDCPEHGVLQVKVPWSEARSRFTLLFECFVIDVIAQCANIQGACRLLRLNWDEVWGVMNRAVARGLNRKQERVIPALGIDEKAFKKGHKYMTVVCDLERATVEHVAEDRKAESLQAFWKSLSPEQLDGVEAVSMDMWTPYIQATMQCLPDADQKIVFDRFHIMSHMVKAVDTVRKQEHRQLSAAGDDTLKGTKYLWLFSSENLPDKHRPKFEGLKEMNLKVGKAWAIKESLRELWEYRHPELARHFFKKWYAWASHARLEPVRKVAAMIKKHLENVLTYCRHRVTNAVAEGLNSKIMTIKRRACGYRNKEHFKTAIYFFCGGLHLYPC
jgi:transposase